MTFDRTVLPAFLCIALTQVNSFISIFFGIFKKKTFTLYSTLSQAGLHALDWWGPVIYDYEITTFTYHVYPQDDLDAQAIIDGKMSETVFASIIPYRDKCRRTTIIREISSLNGGVCTLDI